MPAARRAPLPQLLCFIATLTLLHSYFASQRLCFTTPCRSYFAICFTLASTVDRAVLKDNLMIMNTVVHASLKVCTPSFTPH